ncbi:MAG: hypothetical protein RMJ28_07395 [Nitrososphaerota archaeon]|nr:hypothetical protein [Candidatus Calditenuaceae archaeon]MDW8074036.1 hypothetical protein [Nitrososphaerota archaeon]
MSRLLLLELRLFTASPVRLAFSVAAPLAPIALRLAGVLDEVLVEPLFIVAYQFLAMTLLPVALGLLRGGWRLAWFAGPPDSVAGLSLAYLGLFALTSAPPVAAFQALALLLTSTLPAAQPPTLILYTLSIGILHQSLALFLQLRLRGSAAGWAAVLTYQALLITFASSMLAGAPAESYAPLMPLFPALLAIAPQAQPETLYVAAPLCIAFSLLFTYLAAVGVVRPARESLGPPI